MPLGPYGNDVSQKIEIFGLHRLICVPNTLNI